MAYVKVPAPSVVYHLAKADRLDSILDDGQIRRFEDSECWFCESLPKMKAYMEQTVMCEGKPYYAVGGQLCRYPKFVPEDYVLLKLAPCQPKDNWYRWDQEVPPGSPKELIKAAKEFSALKIARVFSHFFCGNVKYLSITVRPRQADVSLGQSGFGAENLREGQIPPCPA